MNLEYFIRYYKALGYSDEEAESRARSAIGVAQAEPEQEEKAGGFFAGLKRGGAETVSSYVGGIGGILDPELYERSRQFEQDRPELTGAGEAGRVVGRLGTELAGLFAGGGLALKGAAKIPSVARALQGASRTQRGLATAAASLPIDVAQAAAYREGAVLPGFGGALAENVALSGGLGALFGAGRGARAAGEVGEAAEEGMRALPPGQYEMTSRINPERMLPERAGPEGRPFGGRDITDFEAPRPRDPIITPPPRRPIDDPERLLPAGEGRVRPFPLTPPEGATPTSSLAELFTEPDRFGRGARRTLIGPERKPPLIPPAPGQSTLEEVLAPKPRIEGDQYTLFTGLPAAGLSSLKSELAQSAIGAGVGAAIGGAGDEEGQYTGALLGGVAGLAAPILARRLLSGMRYIPEPTRPSVSGAAGDETAEALERELRAKRGSGATAYESALGRGQVGTPKIDVELNNSTLAIDDEGSALLGQIREKLLATKVRVSDEEVRRLAKQVDVDEIIKGGRIALDTVDQYALGLAYKAAKERRLELLETLRNLPPTASIQQREALEAAIDRLQDYQTNYLIRWESSTSESGRSLRMAGQTAALLKDERAYLRAAKQALGTNALPDEVVADVVRIFNLEKSDKEKARILVDYLSKKKQPTLAEVLADGARWTLLTAPASFIRNIVGGIEASTQMFLDGPVASAFDKFLRGNYGVNATSIGSISAKARPFVKELRRQVGEEIKPFVEFNETGFDGIIRRFGTGIDPEDPYSSLNRNQRLYETYVGGSKSDWLKTLTPAARVLDTTRNLVYGAIAAGDRPVFNANFVAALTERAMLKAIRDGLEPGTDAFNAAVKRYADPNQDLNALSVFMANVEALEATFKTQTPVPGMIKALGRAGGPAAEAIGQFLIPFANTPTNIVRKALERVPGIGQAIGTARLRNLETKLNGLRSRVQAMSELGARYNPDEIISAADVQRELTKFKNEILARQVTGPSMILAGYALHKAGLLTPEYVEPIGATPEEREEMRRRGLTGSGALSLRVGDTTYSVSAALGITAPLLAIGAAMSLAEEAEEPVPLSNRIGVGIRSAFNTAQSIPLLTGIEDVRDLASGKRDVAEYAGRQARRFIPGSAGIALASRVMDTEAGRREPEGFLETVAEGIPFARQTLPERVNPLGDVIGAPNPLAAILSPFTPSRTASGEVYDILEDIDFFPMSPRKLPEESEREYSERRQVEGEREREVILNAYNGLISSGYLTEEQIKNDPDAQEEARRIISRALSRLRTRTSRSNRVQQALEAVEP